jgi:hypothetical protein
MIKLQFGERQKHSYRGTGLYDKHHKLKLNTQVYTRQDSGVSGTSASTQLVFNLYFDVSEALWQNCLPKFDNQFNITPDSFATLRLDFTDFELGKSMAHWKNQDTGYAPCVSLKAKHCAGAPLLKLLEKELENLKLNCDGQQYRVCESGIGYYLGKKGADKWADRKSGTCFHNHLNLNSSVQHEIDGNVVTWGDTINLELGFTLAKHDTNTNTAASKLQHFYYGNYPELSAVINIHLKKKITTNTITNWADVRKKLRNEISTFSDFLKTCVKIPGLFRPSIFINHQPKKWTKDGTRAYTPVTSTDVDTVHPEIIHDLPAPIEDKKKETKPGSKARTNQFSVFNDDCSSDSDKD